MKKNTILRIVVSYLVIRAILMQDETIVAFESRKWNFVEFYYLIHEKELLEVIRSLKVWRHYIQGVKFKIQTDHKSLRYLSTQHNLNRQKCR